MVGMAGDGEACIKSDSPQPAADLNAAAKSGGPELAEDDASALPCNTQLRVDRDVLVPAMEDARELPPLPLAALSVGCPHNLPLKHRQ